MPRGRSSDVSAARAARPARPISDAAPASTRSDVVAALNELADRGFIKRSPDPDDGRRNVITITPAGTEQLGALEKVLADSQETLLAPLSAADRTKLIRLLTRLLEDDAQA